MTIADLLALFTGPVATATLETIGIVFLAGACAGVIAILVILGIPKGDPVPLDDDDKVHSFEPHVKDFEQLLLRDEVRRGLAAGETPRAIARRLLVPIGTVLNVIDTI